ncbi:MAG: extensin-like protein [Rhodobacterales bacterium]|nr:MAG: extensin-like protein [Rhodobacterales bacterium]
MAALAGPASAQGVGLRPEARPQPEAPERPIARPAPEAPVDEPLPASPLPAPEEVAPTEPGAAAAPEIMVTTPSAPSVDARPDAPPIRPEGLADRALASRVTVALRPPARPAGITRAAEAARAARARGAVCGTPALQGEAIARIGTPGSGCGIANPVRLRSVAGVRLSTPARVDCQTAQALLRWVERSVKPSVARRGGGAAELYVMASYACRTRNSRPGARLSEHAKGHAIDIGGLTLRDGTRIRVLGDWGRGWKGQALANMRRQACGTFGTVLGPGSDRYHGDHFHFDTARYRSGPYCR